MALARLDEDPTRLPEMADVLLALHQCERCLYRYIVYLHPCVHLYTYMCTGEHKLLTLPYLFN